MIGLAARLAVSGGRESLVRLALTALGVAAATAMLLLAAAGDPAIRAHQRHTAWQHTLSDPEAHEGSGTPLLWRMTDDYVDGRALTTLFVGATGPGAPVPLGLEHVPAPGEVHVSPALAELRAELPDDQLADRFPAAPAGLIGDEFLAGPDDLVAVVGAEPAELERMGAAEVHRIRTRPEQFQFTDVLRLVLGIGAVGLLMPVLVFVSTSTRIGAARREQRYAALRLAGATPRQTNLVAGFEAGAAAVAGTALGAVGYLVLRPAAARIEIDGHQSFLADLRVAPAVLALVLVGVPALAVAAATASLRRLRISPLGAARRSPRPRPTGRRLLPLAVGAAAFVVSFAAAIGRSGGGMLIPVMVAFALMIYGIVVAGPWLTYLTARALRRAGRGPGALLAGRRLEDDPSSGFRAVSGLVLAVFVASVFSGVTPSLLEDNRSDRTSPVPATAMLVSFPEGAPPAEGRAALAAAAAAGAGDGVVFHVDPDPDRALADPAVGRDNTLLVACDDLGVLRLPRSCPRGTTAWVDVGLDDLPVEPAPYSPDVAAAMPVELAAVPTDGTTATTDRVRTAIRREVPEAVVRLAAEADAEANRELVQLNRLANLGLAVTLAVAGCSLAVAVAAGIIERRRPFTLLRLAGMHLAELQRTALLEAAAPLLLIAAATAVLGVGTAAVIIGLIGGVGWRPPSVGYWMSLGGGLAVAVAVAAAALPLLGRSTAPSTARFE